MLKVVVDLRYGQPQFALVRTFEIGPLENFPGEHVWHARLGLCIGSHVLRTLPAKTGSFIEASTAQDLTLAMVAVHRLNSQQVASTAIGRYLGVFL
eukprot:CAMPEP_0170473020 /NCGR_PEP_ID=MMETSP0123-20130129/14975_1 /TAXON_ID=182087 /ORGANISM="Favella ehrenbergii, Strain Fehren 1" /LENGTH=95 /DNA_ID=CAMNT_0010741721 /DNA_START=1179 /DNA_END=1463 /DNA_ORIENTATION=-